MFRVVTKNLQENEVVLGEFYSEDRAKEQLQMYQSNSPTPNNFYLKEV